MNFRMTQLKALILMVIHTVITLQEIAVIPAQQFTETAQQTGMDVSIQTEMAFPMRAMDFQMTPFDGSITMGMASKINSTHSLMIQHKPKIRIMTATAIIKQGTEVMRVQMNLETVPSTDMVA